LCPLDDGTSGRVEEPGIKASGHNRVMVAENEVTAVLVDALKHGSGCRSVADHIAETEEYVCARLADVSQSGFPCLAVGMDI